MGGCWRNLENNQSEKVIVDSACNPKMVVIAITLLLMLPVGQCHSVVALAAAETDAVKTIVSYSIVGR